MKGLGGNWFTRRKKGKILVFKPSNDYACVPKRVMIWVLNPKRFSHRLGLEQTLPNANYNRHPIKLASHQ